MKSQKSSHMSENNENLSAAGLSASRSNGLMTVAVERGVSVFGHSMRVFQEEGMRFLTRRMEDNAKAVQDLGSCKSLPDFLAMQRRWFADMTRAYSEEWSRYSDIVSEALHEGEKAVEEGSSQARRASETH